MNFRIDYITPKKTTRKKKISILGKTVAVTGALPGMNRRQAQWWITTIKSASYSSIVDRRVAYLIIGKSRSSKTASKVIQAQKLGIQMISFEDID